MFRVVWQKRTCEYRSPGRELGRRSPVPIGHKQRQVLTVPVLRNPDIHSSLSVGGLGGRK